MENKHNKLVNYAVILEGKYVLWGETAGEVTKTVSVLHRLGLTEEVNFGQRLQRSAARNKQISVGGGVENTTT